jgi:hypothetical protein
LAFFITYKEALKSMPGETAPQTANAEQAGPAPAPEQIEISAEPAESAPAEQEPSQTTEAQGSEPEEGKKVVEELKHVRKRAQTAEQEAAYWRGVAEAKAQMPQATEQASQSDKVPNLADYSNYDDYLVAKAKYEVRQEQDQRQQVEYQNNIDRNYNERFNQAAKDIPDLPEAIRNARIPMQAQVITAIKESDVGPRIAYHLAKNPDDAIKLSQMTPSAAIREIGKIEARLTMKTPQPNQTKQISRAPEPIKPLGNLVTASVADFDKMSMDDFVKRRNTETFVKSGNRLVPKR